MHLLTPSLLVGAVTASFQGRPARGPYHVNHQAKRQDALVVPGVAGSTGLDLPSALSAPAGSQLVTTGVVVYDIYPTISTSTVLSTSYATVFQCPDYVTDCPARSVTTATSVVVVSTSICPTTYTSSSLSQSTFVAPTSYSIAAEPISTIVITHPPGPTIYWTEPAESSSAPVEVPSYTPIVRPSSTPVKSASSTPVEASSSAPAEVSSYTPVETPSSSPTESASSTGTEVSSSSLITTPYVYAPSSSSSTRSSSELTSTSPLPSLPVPNVNSTSESSSVPTSSPTVIESLSSSLSSSASLYSSAAAPSNFTVSTSPGLTAVVSSASPTPSASSLVSSARTYGPIGSTALPSNGSTIGTLTPYIPLYTPPSNGSSVGAPTPYAPQYTPPSNFASTPVAAFPSVPVPGNATTLSVPTPVFTQPPYSPGSAPVTPGAKPVPAGNSSYAPIVSYSYSPGSSSSIYGTPGAVTPSSGPFSATGLAPSGSSPAFYGPNGIPTPASVSASGLASDSSSGSRPTSLSASGPEEVTSAASVPFTMVVIDSSSSTFTTVVPSYVVATTSRSSPETSSGPGYTIVVPPSATITTVISATPASASGSAPGASSNGFGSAPGPSEESSLVFGAAPGPSEETSLVFGAAPGPSEETAVLGSPTPQLYTVVATGGSSGSLTTVFYPAASPANGSPSSQGPSSPTKLNGYTVVVEGPDSTVTTVIPTATPSPAEGYSVVVEGPDSTVTTVIPTGTAASNNAANGFGPVSSATTTYTSEVGGVPTTITTEVAVPLSASAGNGQPSSFDVVIAGPSSTVTTQVPAFEISRLAPFTAQSATLVIPGSSESETTVVPLTPTVTLSGSPLSGESGPNASETPVPPFPSGFPGPASGYGLSVIVPGSTTVVIPPGSYPSTAPTYPLSNATATQYGNISIAAGMAPPTAVAEYRGAAAQDTVAWMMTALLGVLVIAFLL